MCLSNISIAEGRNRVFLRMQIKKWENYRGLKFVVWKGDGAGGGFSNGNAPIPYLAGSASSNYTKYHHQHAQFQEKNHVNNENSGGGKAIFSER